MSNETLIGSVNKGNEAFFIADYLKKNNKCSLLYIARNEKEIFDIKSKIEWLIPSVEILVYRSWDQIPYDSVSPSREIQSERINTLYKIYHNKNKYIVISSVNAILQKTIDVDFINNNFIEIFLNKRINFEQLINKLIFLGYQRTSVVREKSEFAIRGSIIDIFLSDRNKPIRIDFFDQNIETISEFDRLTQKTTQKIDENILITPSSELLINNKSLNLFRKSFREIFSEYRHSQIYNLFSNSIIPSGGENFLPLFNESLSTIFSYCLNYHIILNNDFQNLLDMRIENINDFFSAREEGGDNFHLPPKNLYLNYKNIQNNFINFSVVKLHEYNLDKEINFKINKLPNLSSIRKEIDFKFIKKFFEINYKKHIVICSRSNGSLDRIKKILLEQLQINFVSINNFDELENEEKLNITVLKIDESVEYQNYIFLNEKSLFGYNFSTHKSVDQNKEVFFEEINKLTKNSILVHSEYGLCRFLNIKKLEINQSHHDCVELEFADDQKLFLPIENLNFITKYGNDDNNNAQLDRLGSSHWQKRKAKAKNKIKEAAKNLMITAAKRLKSQSHKIDFNPSEYEKFSSTFPFIETDDQAKTIEEVIADFSKSIPADRLIVGDVAFGKTEVIIRAVFLAAKSKIQSLVLVPTTLLSRQHFNNFSNRLIPFGIKVGEISRLVPAKEKLKIISSLKEGTIDVIIGTHALLSNKIHFKKLGLIIYDEEQKLGTQQKEKFKSIAPRAHVLSLSATPIPRTLSLSLSGIRDLSLIQTAPYERLSVRTFISSFDEITIIEAIKREIHGRKNGVFFVTPRKRDIPFLERFINEKLPEVKYVTAHGQLAPKILESRITKFYNQEVPLLISTNIIENGLDLPHVNTIIVYRSHIFSLAGIYQLRGRVGRSSKRGYAYLTYNEKEMTENARKRLNVINSFDKIGSGFNIATQDLDLRGGGSIIGEEQSGFIKEVGTELYHQMLEEEILRQKNQLFKDSKIVIKPSFQPIIRIPEEIFIPDEFINDLDIKMSVYKRISLITNNQERNNLMTELVDRFGKLPNEVENLFQLIEIKILCLRNNIEQIEFGRKGILFSFYKNIPKNPEKILKIGLSKDKQITIRSDQKVFYDFLGNINDNRFALVKNIIKKFH